jgi:hypothetical protein
MFVSFPNKTPSKAVPMSRWNKVWILQGNVDDGKARLDMECVCQGTDGLLCFFHNETQPYLDQ